MGWTSYTINTTATTDETLRREFTEAGTNGSRWEITDTATIGATWYAISKRTDATGQAHYSGLVCFTERRTQRNGTTEFSYKDMGEECGPHAYACPARILDQLDQLAPNPGGYAAGWRQAEACTCVQRAFRTLADPRRQPFLCPGEERRAAERAAMQESRHAMSQELV